MSADRGPGRGAPLARRLLEAALPDDDWCREFLQELDEERAAARGGRGPRAPGLWYARRALSPRTLHYALLMARRRAGGRRARGAGPTPLGDLGLDVRHALRVAAREPRTAFFIALTLALGIGSVSAMYGVADRLFLSGPRHVAEHEELFRTFLSVANPVAGERTTPWIPYLTATALQRDAPGFERSALYRFSDDLARFGADVGPVRVSEVDGRYFDVLGTAPAAGRFFGGDTAGGDGAPAVVSHAMALAAFGGPEAAVGRPLDLTGGSYTVVAVAREGFSGPHLQRVDVWIPVEQPSAGNRNWQLVGRVPGPGARRAAADRIAGGAQAVHDRTDPGRFFQWAVGARVVIAPVSSDDTGSPSAEAAVARLLFAVAALVLLIACANVVNLLLARTTRRRDEVVLRLALGSGRWRLVRLLMAESLVSGLAGGLLSVPVAYVGGAILQSVLLPQVAWGRSPVEARILAVAAAVAALTGLALGLLPARLAGRTELSSGMASGRVSAGRSRARTQVVLATAQVALSAVLLLCAGLFLESFRTIRVTDLGIEAGEVLAIRLRSMDSDRLSDGADDESEVYGRALRTLRGMDGAERSALTVGLPFLYTFGTSVRVPGVDSIPELPGGGPYVSAVTGRYFDAVGTRIVRGAPITDEQVSTRAQVAVVSASAADLLWPGVDPLGKCVRLGSGESPCSTVVGVAADVHQSGYREPTSMQLYVPLGTERGFSGMSLVVRPAAGVAAAERIRGVLASVDPAVDYVDVARLESSIEPQVRPWRLGAVVLTVMSTLAALVSLIGVYGVLSYLIAQRRREIGVRIALGASRESIRGLVLRGGLVAGAVGVAAGFAAVLAGGPWLGPLLFETSVADPLVMAVVATMLLGAAAAACILPALQASRIAPVECLRDG